MGPIPSYTSGMDFGTGDDRTVTVHQQVVSAVRSCGHKVTANWMPSNHCEECWIAYFAGIPTTVHENFQRLVDGKDEQIKHEFGTKYLKHFKRFVQHVQEVGAKKQEEELATS